MKRARTFAEMRFAAQLEPCPTCGSHDVGTFDIRHGTDVVWVSWRCSGCKTVRTMGFAVDGNPSVAPAPAKFELGPGPSELIAPETFLDALTQAAGQIAEPATLVQPQWEAAFDSAIFALTAATELLKMVPAGADRIAGSTDVRLSRNWLERERDRLRAVVSSFIADRDSKDANTPPPPTPIGTIDRASLEAHAGWLRRGGSGDGRLVLRHVRANGTRYGTLVLTSADLADCVLTNVDLSYSHLDKTTLTRCVFDGSDLSGGTVADATISGGSWKRARLAALFFTNTRVTETDFSGADLERGLFWDARVAGAIFDGVRFGNARFDRAVFERCRCRGASFAKLLDTPEPTSTDAQFVDCDFTDTDWSGRNLKSTTFVRCTFKGARGKPVATDGLMVRDCDVELSALIAQLH